MIGRNFPQFPLRDALWTSGGLDLTTDFVMNRFYYDYSNSFRPKPSSPAEGVLRREGISQMDVKLRNDGHPVARPSAFFGPALRCVTPQFVAAVADLGLA